MHISHINLSIFILSHTVQARWFGTQLVKPKRPYCDFEPELNTKAASVTKKFIWPPKTGGASSSKEGSTNVDEGKDELDVMGSDKESEIEEHNIKVLMYVNIKTPPPPLICVAGHTTKPPGPKITVQGPFAFQSNISYNDFLSIVAKGMGMCSANCII